MTAGDPLAEEHHVIGCRVQQWTESAKAEQFEGRKNSELNELQTVIANGYFRKKLPSLPHRISFDRVSSILWTTFSRLLAANAFSSS
jgi:hypothetical protein